MVDEVLRKLCSFEKLVFMALNYRYVIGFVVLSGWHTMHAQMVSERQAFNNLQKGKYDKAWSQLTKVIRKDSSNTAAWYVCTAYFFDVKNPAFHVDSAYKYVMVALSQYPAEGTRQHDRLKRFPMDSVGLVATRKSIDSAAFERAKQINTEQAYLDFIAGFPYAAQQERARELRDEVAYIDALKENTYASFLKYLNRYPNASRAPEARERYEKLLFEAKTKDRKLASYINFIREYPESPYRDQAERQVLEVATASGETETFLSFIKTYPSSKQINRVRNVYYHLAKEHNQEIPAFMLTDSLRSLIKLEQEFLVPVFRDGKFGFIDSQGQEVIPPQAERIGNEYICGNITEELLVLNETLIARNGAVVFKGLIEALDDLGYGFLLVPGETCGAVVHKSGFVVEPCAEDARVVGGAFLAIKRDQQWTLKTFLGRDLPIGSFEEVTSIDEVIGIRQGGKWMLTLNHYLAAAADHHPVELRYIYDEVKPWATDLIWVRSGNSQGLLDMRLDERVALAEQEIGPAFFGAVSKTHSGYRLWNKVEDESLLVSDVKIQKPWVAVQQHNQWRMAYRNISRLSHTSFDSLYFIGPICMAIKSDTARAYLSDDFFVTVSPQARVRFMPGKDSVYYLLLEEGERKHVYNSSGELLFIVQYDEIDVAGDQFFTVTKKNKRGLITQDGKLVIPADYDAMGNIQQGTIPVLKDKKFGYLDVRNRREIKPQYEKNIIRYNDHYLIAFKGGYSGLIDWNNKSITPFEYDEIRYWNDSSALVRKNFQWMIYDFIKQKVVADKIRNFKWLRDTPHDKLAIVQQEHSFGVLSNKRGFILQPTFSDIVNLGSATQPLYFTEKHVEEASISVVIYYDAEGRILRRQVFEADEYERIHCSQK